MKAPNQKNKNLKNFPKNFLWGVAHSSHQVEGNNKNNDWHEWEQKGKTKDFSGLACDSWNKFPEDHDLAQKLGCNAFRLSLEWSRIEPEEGKFNQKAIDHYRKVLQDLKARNIKTVVTLWHWTLPLWFSKKYGWHHKDSVEIFARYCEKVVGELGGEIDFLLTTNEPLMTFGKGYLLGDFPPGKIAPWKFLKARKNMILSHKKCYDVCKKQNKNLPIGITQYHSFIGSSKNPIAKLIRKIIFYRFYDQVGDKQDFIGINYYKKSDLPWKRNKNKKVTDFGWEIYPKGIYEVIMDAHRRYQKPIYIFENGLADKEDKYRKDYITDHLKYIKKAIEDGADVRGYFHWSLLDNFEWNEAFEMKFGLCEIDFKDKNRPRTPRPSFYHYQRIIKNNKS